jgi:ribose transport system substrate-binding protein
MTPRGARQAEERKLVKHNSRRRRLAAAAPLIVAATLLASCGSDSSGGGGSTTGGGGGAKADTAQFDQLVQAATAGGMSRDVLGGVRWAGAEDSPPPARGVTVGVMPCLLVLESCQVLGRNAEEAAAAMGWRSIVVDGRGDPGLEQAAVDSLINRGVKCIVSLAVPGRDYKAQIARAKEKGIHTVVGFADDPRPFGGDSLVDLDQENTGEVLGAYIMANGGGGLVTFNAPQDPQLTKRTQGTARYVEEHGGEVVQQQDFALSQLGQGQIPMMQAILQRHPKGTIKWVVAPFDEALPPLIQVAKQQGRDEIRFLAFNGSQVALDSIRDDAGQAATISWALDWVSWAAIDECNRAIQGAPTGVNTDFAVQLTDRDNVPPKGESWEPEFDFRSEYKKRWDAARNQQ